VIRSLLAFVIASLSLFLFVDSVQADEFSSSLPPQFSDGAQRAFPTAEGYGALALGGRGGEVVHVTNLDDGGKGSLRYALSSLTGPRTIVFDVGGVIELTRNIVIQEGNVTVAGQTAPGNGVCLRGGTISVKAPDVILRHLCIRRGDGPGSNRGVADGLQFNHAQRAIADHISASWSLDEALETYFSDTEDITVQYSLFYEPLDGLIDETQGEHGFGPLLGNEGQRQTFYRNVIGHVQARAPRLANVQDVDVVNNIIFNWGNSATRVTNGSKGREPAGRINIVNNVYRPGNDTGGSELSLSGQDGNSQIYIAGNEDHLGFPVDYVDADGRDADALIDTPNARPEYAAVTAQPSWEVWDTLLDQAGARVPVLDEADAMFLQQVRDGSGTIVDCVDLEDQADSLLIEPCQIESALGRFPTYPTASRPAGFDSDDDGMPDAWEIQYGLNPDDPGDRNGDMVGDGWTNLEYYLNHLAGDYQVAQGDPSQVTVLDVVGLAQSVAETAIVDAGLAVGAVTEDYSDTMPAGSVMSQNPLAGASVALGSAVGLAVSLGPAAAPPPVSVSVPDVVGLTQAAAETAISDTGLTVGVVTQEYSDSVPAGSVISESPTAGTLVALGSAVDLWVSLGPAPVTVPDVVGLTQASAQTAIAAANLNVGAVTQEYSATVPAGTVMNQSPAAGASVAVGSTVDLWVSLGPAPVTVPDVVGLMQAVAESAIVNAGLTVGAISQQYSDTVSSGAVISQSPASGLLVAAGSAVDLTVSLGPAPAPAPAPDPLTVTDMSPDIASRATTFVATITGSGFGDDTQVSFGNGQGPAPDVIGLSIDSTTTLRATIEVKSGGPPRLSPWDLFVTSGGASVVLPNALTVSP